MSSRRRNFWRRGFVMGIYFGRFKHGLKTRATIGVGEIAIMCAVGITTMAWGAESGTLPAPSQPPARRETYSERYGVLAARNIFVRDRTRPRGNGTTQPAAATQESVRTPEQLLMLTGVVLEEDGFRAYAENLDSFLISKLAPGDTIARGKITSIDIDAVEYEQSGAQRKWIVIGHDFTGRPAMFSAAASVLSVDVVTTGPASSGPVLGGKASTAPAAAVPGNSSDPNLSAEQKMRLRRQTELKR